MTESASKEAAESMVRSDGTGRLRRWAWLPLLASPFLAAGCRSSQRVGPIAVANPFLGTATIAVAPAVNVSGSTDFDPNRFADLMASELSHADRVSVIPVSRVLGALAAQGRDRVESAAHALEIAELVGADAILVFAVTEYDPYDPPSIGIAAQLYGRNPWPGFNSDGAGSAETEGAGKGRDAKDRKTAAGRLLAESQRVFNAAHADVVDDIRSFARQRDADESPYGWRRYVVSQQYYIRYCCSATIRALLNGEHAAVVARGSAGER
ncbi:MAG: hypothetical protein Q7R41_02810 [Phycisphaerales bacterium]|nr:hypothetical protein [Phycisphaerales bacterium]